MDRISVVIPAYNPPPFLSEAIASARVQAGVETELILVNDGTNQPESLELLSQAKPLVDRYLEQPNRGLAAARNTGFRAATADVVIPLDADDILDPHYAATCLQALDRHRDAAFVYTDFRFFGAENYPENLPDYNLYHLLDRHTITYCAAIRGRDWEIAGGYDESMSHGYEDWEFWLRLAEGGRFGKHIPGVLFQYRKHGASLLDHARAHHSEITAYIRQRHPALYADDGRAEVKKRWWPATCILAPESEVTPQTIVDWTSADDGQAGAFLLPAGPLHSDSAELAALAIWAGRDRLMLPDGSQALSREAQTDGAAPPANLRTPPAPAGPTIRRHLSNAGLLSLEAWTHHPLRSAGRLVPLRVKERINQAAGRQVFDLSFYLQFRPASIQAAGAVHQPLRYCPRPSPRKRIAFVTPHLGPGGAESVLLSIAGTVDRACYELLLLTTQSCDDSWRPRWEKAVDHVYDLQQVVGFDKAAPAIYSIVANWRVETLLVQNSLTAYSILPQLKEHSPALKTIDLIHSVDKDWDVVAATGNVAEAIDVRVAISETVRTHLRNAGTPDAKIRLIRNAVPLAGCPPQRTASPSRILFAGRLDPVKRPLLLVEIARELRRRQSEFRFVIAGDGAERPALEQQIRKRGLEAYFDLRGQVSDLAPLLEECDLVVLPSAAEGVPLIILEAFAACRTVVASAVGGVPEVVTPKTGFAIPRRPQEVADFADVIDELLNDHAWRESLARSGRNLVEQLYNPQRFTEEYRALLTNVCAPES